MAYTPGQKLEGEEEEAQGGGGAGAPTAPTISGPSIGSTASVGGTVAGSSPVGQSNASGGGAGTGFVNIDKYIGANKGVGQDVKARGDQALDKDAGAFGAKASETQANIDANKDKIVKDPSALVGGVLGATGDEQKAAAIKTAQDALAASFSGAAAVDYDVGNTDEVKKANALGNAQSAGKQIAQDNNTLSQYGTGLQAIDAAIYGSQQEAPELQQVADRVKTQTGDQQTRAGTIAADAATTAGAIGKSAADTRQAFVDKAGALQGDARAKAIAAQAEEDARRTSIESDNADIRAQNEAAQVFNVDSLPATQIAEGMMSSNAKAEDIAKATKNMTPEELERYRAIREKYGPKFNPYMAADLAKGWQPGAQKAESVYTPGSGMADASSFLDANGLSAIGAVLGDQNMANTVAGPAYQAGQVTRDAAYEAQQRAQRRKQQRSV